MLIHIIIQNLKNDGNFGNKKTGHNNVLPQLRRIRIQPNPLWIAKAITKPKLKDINP